MDIGWNAGPPDITDSHRVADRKRAIKALGRPLLKHQHVHHHSLTQLVICDSPAYHMLLHVRTAAVREGRDPDLISDGKTHSYILRNIDPDLWQAAKVKAFAEGSTLKGVIHRLLTAYVEGKTSII